MTRAEHCERLGISIGRILGKMSKHKISFEEAIQLPLERISSHCIDGVVKNNYEWYDHFSMPKKRELIIISLSIIETSGKH